MIKAHPRADIPEETRQTLQDAYGKVLEARMVAYREGNKELQGRIDDVLFAINNVLWEMKE